MSDEDFVCKGSGAIDISQFNTIEEFFEYFINLETKPPKEETKTITIQGNGDSVIKIGKQ